MIIVAYCRKEREQKKIVIGDKLLLLFSGISALNLCRIRSNEHNSLLRIISFISFQPLFPVHLLHELWLCLLFAASA